MRRRPSAYTVASRTRVLRPATPSPLAQGTASARPSYCPSPAVIDAKLAALATYFATHTDSDDRATAFDNFNAGVQTPCLSKAQAERLKTIAVSLDKQARAEEANLNDTFGIVRLFEERVLPVLKIAAGGLGLLVTGAALVYVAGRYTGAGKAVTGAAGAAAKVASPVAKKVSSARAERAYGRQRRMEFEAREAAPKDAAIGEPGIRLNSKERYRRVVPRRNEA